MNFLNKLLEMAGGKAEKEGTTEEDVDAIQLKIGIAVEMEHTNNKEISKQIALDHLTEHKDYYTKLIRAGLVDEKPALEMFKKYIGK